MSIEKIIENIENNILERSEADEVLRALELVTRMPVTFKRMVDAGLFFATHHDIHDGCPTGNQCDDCYSGDTEFEHKCDLSDAAVSLFKHMNTSDGNDDAEEGSDSEGNEPEITEPMTEELPYYPQRGFRNPILILENMVGFLKEADMGLSDPSDPSSDTLSGCLMATENRICTIAMLTPLFNIYAHINQMQTDPGNKQFLTATPLMHKWFGETFKELQNRPVRYNARGEEIPEFDPERFRYNRFQAIRSLNSIKRDTLTKEQLDHMYSDEILQRLDQDQEVVSGAMRWYREQVREKGR